MLTEIDASPFGASVKRVKVFYGPPQTPLLAPRGVFVYNNKLIVSDTGRNRVLIWNEIPSDEFQDPDVVVGQTDPVQAGINASESPSASTLHYPSGLWADGRRLIVADAWNHRVLVWHTFPTHYAQPADIVLGQKNFNSVLPNEDGVGASPSRYSTHWCYGVCSDGKGLWVADTGNRRVLHYDSIPENSYAPADHVIGKPDFVTKDYEDTQPIWPYSIRISSEGGMAVADPQFFRTMIWNNTLGTGNTTLVGQPNFNSNGQNQFRLTPNAHCLNWTYDNFFYKKGMFVCDTGNSRILWFPRIPDKNNQKSAVVIGKRDFETSSENSDTLSGTDSSLYWPFCISMINDTMVVADTGNHRILFLDVNLTNQ